MFLKTDRLILREFSPDDFDDVHEYSSDYENVRHMMFGPNTPEQTYNYLNVQCVKEQTEEPRMHYNIAVVIEETGKLIGGISLHMNWRRDDAIIGIILNRNYSGKGYMTEAFNGVLKIAFTQLSLHRVHAICDVENASVMKLFEKVGMRREGLMIQRGKNRPEEPVPYFDQYGYAILASEWKEKNC